MSQSNPGAQVAPTDEPTWWDAVPVETASRLTDEPVVGAGFAVGPGFVAGKGTSFDPPTDVAGAIAWLQRYPGLRRCHVEFAEGTLVYFESGGRFFSVRHVSERGRPSPGITVGHPPRRDGS